MIRACGSLWLARACSLSCSLGLPDLLDFLQRLLQSLLPLAHCPLLRCPLARRLLLPRIAHRLHLFAGRFQMFLQPLLPPETVRPGTGFDPGAIVHHPLQTHQPLRLNTPSTCTKSSRKLASWSTRKSDNVW